MRSHSGSSSGTGMRTSGGSATSLGGVSGVALAGAVLCLCLGAAVALTDLGATYSWQDNMMSDLGDNACHVADRTGVCSPRFVWFNAGVIAAGCLLLVAAARLSVLWGLVLTAAITAMGVGLILLGAFPAGRASGIHMVGVVLALPVPAAGVLSSGIRPRTTWLHRFRRFRIFAGSAALILCAEQPFRGEVPVPRAIAELLAVAALLAFLSVESVRLLTMSAGRSDGRGR